MKFLFLLLTFLVFSANSFANYDTALRRSNGLLRFLTEQQGVRNLALASVIGKRCDRYMIEREKAPCRAAVKKMIALLDYDIIFSHDKLRSPNPRAEESWTPSSFVFVAFKSNLLVLLNSPKTGQYLNDLNQRLYAYLVNRAERPNIWAITQSYYKTPYMTALVMATLFQDTSIMKLHLAYLDTAGTRGNESFQKNKEWLGHVIDTINMVLDNSEEHYRELFYPPEIVKHLNRNIYHFYVPLFLAMSLEQEGATKEMAYAASLMLTLTYEFLTSAKDYRYLYADPERLDPVKDLWDIKDIYGGYCGSNYGVRGARFNQNFEIIRESFGRSTEDTVQLLLRH